MSKDTIKLVRKFGVILSVLISLFLLWVAWLTHLWMPPGQTVLVAKCAFDEYEFQIWQDKNQSLAEPFSASLYVRHRHEAWKQYYLNHQDIYSPNYTLVRDGLKIHVFRSSKQIGSFDMLNSEYERSGGGVSFEGILVGDPPHKW